MGNAYSTPEFRWHPTLEHSYTQDTVWIGGCGYPFRKGEEDKDLPTQRAWCKHCARESAKIVAPIWLNGKPAYALECEKCGNMHHMYVHMYRQRYIGTRLPNGGSVAPTRGITSYRNAMDRIAIEKHNQIPKKVEDDMCKLLKCSHEEYREMKKGWEEEDKKIRKKIKNEEANRRAQWKEEDIKRESDKRKELIARGVLVYKKGIGLVNTETGEIVKL